MATTNQVTEQTYTNGKAARHVSHFINISIIQNDGTTLKLGAIPIYEGGDSKVQRSLLAAIESGQLKQEEVALQLDIRENVKSTDVMDVSNWAKLAVNETTAAE